jgi:hypothetical protein
MEEKDKISLYTFGRNQTSHMDFKEVMRNSDDFVSFGVNNDFPQEMIRIYKEASPVFKGLVDKVSMMTYGGGFTFDKELTINEKIFFNNRYAKKNLNQVAREIISNFSLSNSFYLKIEWNEDGTKIAKYEPLPWEKVRPLKKKTPNDVGGWLVSEDWLDKRKDYNKPVFYPDFDIDTAKEEGLENKVQILRVIIPTEGMNYFTLPLFSSSIDSIKTLYELRLFHLSSTKKGFTAGMTILIKGDYTEPEKQALFNEIKKKYTSADEAGDIVMLFAPNEDSIPVITPIQLQDTDSRYLELRNAMIEDVIQGFSTTSIVAGKETSGKLGGTTKEQMDAYTVFQNVVINQRQQIIEDTFQMLAEINGIDLPLKLKKINIFEGIDVSEQKNSIIEIKNN